MLAAPARQPTGASQQNVGVGSRIDLFDDQRNGETQAVSWYCIYLLDSYSGDLWETADVENASREAAFTNGGTDEEDEKESMRKTSVTGVLNPAACFHLGDVILFTVDARHYPLYDL